ncbi:iron complex transport system substrate-binding protein [Paenibacillus forsythiae]|uniref:Iron complex transport system substrate-binding protein n=1 Tax=Paenibacillus forsythiae TaxID=365616 RepID=A0ABU3H5Y5_9BACL|nr:ABC transporter substrate-binding protein [Paenibacillus forsythiae]MDT3425881.1 iron complex transport system substrate-binding protein [Paenibacillus forsythiae]
MKSKSKIISVLCMALLLFVLAACGNKTGNEAASKPSNEPVNDSKPATRIVESVNGPVEIPASPQRIANLWNANNEIMLMMGGGDKLVATTTYVKKLASFQKVYPRINEVTAPFDSSSGDINIEELLKTQPDLIIAYAQDKSLDKLKELNIPVVTSSFTDFDGLKETVRLVGEVLGEDGVKRADEYTAYLEDNFKRVTDITSTIPENERVKVYFTQGFLATDGRNSMAQAWIEAAGGINIAAKDIEGLKKTVTFEQILDWNPDIIVNATPPWTEAPKEVEDMMNNPKWKEIKAVQDNRVYMNPIGVFQWDRYCGEQALQILWAAKMFYPDKFADLNLEQETKDFYKKFFSYDLTDAEVNEILMTEHNTVK